MNGINSSAEQASSNKTAKLHCRRIETQWGLNLFPKNELEREKRERQGIRLLFSGVQVGHKSCLSDVS